MIMIIILFAVIAIMLVVNPNLLGGSMTVPSSVSQWQSLADKYALVSVLDANEILAIIWTESTGNKDSFNPGDPSIGLMGVTNLIGTTYAGIGTFEDLYDPDTNVRAGSGYLADLKSKYSRTFPLGSATGGWVQMYNLGETKFLKGERVTDYETKFQTHFNLLSGG
jgi:membrane-bound lytic murein transglycosylase MltF